MRLDVHELYKSENIRLPSPGQCIYCGNSKSNLRHAHVIPYALAANTMILEKSCCATCRTVIQRYEQEVLNKKLGVFRTQVDAPSRSRKKHRITPVDLPSAEIRDEGRVLGDFG